jgi:Asp/Glu/hydantoin racemase
MTRILVINPNSSAAVTRAIDDAVAPLRLPGGPAVDVVGMASGPRSVSSQRDADGIAPGLQGLVQESDADAFVVACFSDPGLYGAREAAGGRPVFGIAQCGVLQALALGERFGIIALALGSVRRQQRYVRMMGLGERYAGSRPIEADAEESAGAGVFAAMLGAGRVLCVRDGADVLVLGCAGMSGHRAGLERALGVPVVEPARAAVTMALGAVLLAGV